MSFQNKGCWLAKGLGSLNDGEMTCDNSSRIEPKRCNQWSTNGTETELFPNKKQAVELPNHHSFSELLNSNISPWGNTSGFQTISGHFTERLFDTDTTKTINFDDGNSASVGVGNMNMVTKGIEDSFGNGFSFGLSISHTLEDPRSGLNYSGIRKVKVSQVKDSDNYAPVSTGHACTSAMPSSQSYNKADDSSISMGLSFNRRDDNMISVGDTFNRENNNFMLIGQSYDNGGEGDISMGHSFRDNSSATSTCQSVIENNSNTVPMGEIFCKGNEDTISMDHTLKVHSNAVSTGHTTARNDCNGTLMGQTFDNGGGDIVSVSHSYSKADENSMSLNQVCDTIDENSLSISHSFHKGESNIISFGGYNDDDDMNLSRTLLCSYGLIMGQSSGQRSDAISITGMLDANTTAVVSAAQISTCRETVAKKKDEPKAAKKAPPNNFPSNVRSLLSTGMLDGVPVKYTAWSREKELPGIIKGSGYLCGCQSCNYSKAINAYEFERHAGCKTKHPNNHIYFENGKTIYGIVQELRNTPQNLLFEVIQTITGSPINQKSFRLWKESFLAATRELQRIYGKDEGKHLT